MPYKMFSVHTNPVQYEYDALHRTHAELHRMHSAIFKLIEPVVLTEITWLSDVSVFKKSQFRPFSPSTQHHLVGVFKFTNFGERFKKYRVGDRKVWTFSLSE